MTPRAISLQEAHSAAPEATAVSGLPTTPCLSFKTPISSPFSLPRSMVCSKSRPRADRQTSTRMAQAHKQPREEFILLFENLGFLEAKANCLEIFPLLRLWYQALISAFPVGYENQLAETGARYTSRAGHGNSAQTNDFDNRDRVFQAFWAGCAVTVSFSLEQALEGVRESRRPPQEQKKSHSTVSASFPHP